MPASTMPVIRASPSFPAPNTAILLFSNIPLLRAQGTRVCALVPGRDGPFIVKRNHSIVSPEHVDRTYWQERRRQRRSRSIPTEEEFLLLLFVRRYSRRDPIARRGTDAGTPDHHRQRTSTKAWCGGSRRTHSLED